MSIANLQKVYHPIGCYPARHEEKKDNSACHHNDPRKVQKIPGKYPGYPKIQRPIGSMYGIFIYTYIWLNLMVNELWDMKVLSFRVWGMFHLDVGVFLETNEHPKY